jgi:L-ascorbate metabolism protein UlaG (beta-lactamase superfamily)
MRKDVLRFIVLLLIVMLLSSLAGCSGTGVNNAAGQDQGGQTQTPPEIQGLGSESMTTETPQAEPVKKGPAKLYYLGHASVRIETSEGKVIYIDPYAGEDYSVSADLILVTHYHADHYNLKKVTRNQLCKVVDCLDAIDGDTYKSFDIKGIKIQPVPAYNANHNRAECVGYVIEFDGIKLYHAGDTSKTEEMADLASLNLDYALLPMDGVYNMGPEEAMECAALIQAKHTIPIHTGPDGVYGEENVSKFTAEGTIVLKPGDTLELKAD